MTTPYVKIVAGITWISQGGSRWITDPDGDDPGYELFKANDRWFLRSPYRKKAIFIDLRVKRAMIDSAEYIANEYEYGLEDEYEDSRGEEGASSGEAIEATREEPSPNGEPAGLQLQG